MDTPDGNSNRIIQIEDLRNNNSKQYTNDNDGIEVNEDDLLIAWDGANAGLVGFGKKGYLGSTLAVLRKKENIFHTQYVGMFLRTKFDYFQNTSTGATIPHISRLALEELEIPLPSYADQIRIAHLLEKIESLIAECKKSIELLEEMVKAAFYQLFGDPVRNEKGWKKEAIGQYASSIVPGRDKPKSFTGKIRWITTDKLKDLRFVNKNDLNLGLTKEEIKEAKSKIIPSQSILMSCVGDLGIVSIVDFECVANQQLHSYQCGASLNNIFTMFCLSYSKSFMHRMASTTTVPYMNKTICNSIPIILPPLDLQNQFATIVQKIETLKNEQETQVQVMKELYASISQKVFAGGLDLSKIQVDEALLPKETPLAQPEPEDKQDDYDGEEEEEEEEQDDSPEIIEQEKTPKPQKGKAAETETSKETTKPTVEKRPKSTSPLSWDTISFKEVATYIGEHFAQHYFNTEMLLGYLEEDLGINVHYFTSAEQKKNPRYEQGDDFLSFVSGALTGQNTFLSLEQVFYNAETENIPAISFAPNDLETLAGKAKKERSGIYFRIKVKDEVTPS